MLQSLLCLVMAAALWARAPSVDGNWQGMLGASQRVGLHVSKTTAGEYSATLDVINQARSGVQVQQMTLVGYALHFEIPTLNAKYDGTLNADGNEITGALSDAMPTPGRTSISRPLTFKRVDTVDSFGRPQNPKGPIPYDSAEVSYENKPAGVHLAATLTLPRGNGPFPAAILITGSGSQDRDETVAGHKPFLVIADYLTRRGIAVLRVDDRGMGASTGNAAATTLNDSVDDVLIGVRYLKGCREIDPKHIGVIGHSAGGRIGPLAAAQSADITFVVMLAGSGIAFDQNIFAQRAAIVRVSGAGEEAIARDRSIVGMILDVLKSEQDQTTAAEKVKAEWGRTKAGLPESQQNTPTTSDEYVLKLAAAFNTAEVRSALRSDPADTLQQLKVPLLALNGSRDLQVIPQRNLQAVAAALSNGGNPDFTVTAIPGLNHLFQTCRDCSVDEYGKLDETFSPVALEIVGNWILQHVR
jgi:pimeloyl-ACP methyl ester carboxylesterase